MWVPKGCIAHRFWTVSILVKMIVVPRPRKRGDREKNQSRKDLGERSHSFLAKGRLRVLVEIMGLGRKGETDACKHESVKFPRKKSEVCKKSVNRAQGVEELLRPRRCNNEESTEIDSRNRCNSTKKALPGDFVLLDSSDVWKSAALALLHALSTDEFVPEAVTTLSSRAKVERAVSATSAKEINTEEKTNQNPGEKITGNRGPLHACAENHAGNTSFMRVHGTADLG
ncbi:hypothetical protein C8R45DRAFT_937998 [Mycena sanguinolenta]|nr:hypothetical protein C8R45DRAFT_937998 [Mycena sanguinolenta]